MVAITLLAVSHNVACCKPFSTGLEGQFQGRIVPKTTPENERAAVKLTELEINLNMIHLKLLADNSDTILSRASSLNIPLCDCVVKFDLRKCPTMIEVHKYTKSCTKPAQKTRFEESRSKENITCAYCTYFDGGDFEHRVVVMQRFFPHEWLSKQSSRRSAS